MQFLSALSSREDILLFQWSDPEKPLVLSRKILTTGARDGCPTDAQPSIGIGPIERFASMKGRRRIGFVVWETTRIPRAQLEFLAVLDELWTPSRWGADILIDNGVPGDKVKVVPEGVDVQEFRPPSHSKSELARPFRFLCIGKWEVRKCIEELVIAFCLEFKPSEHVELILHCDNPFVPSLDVNDKVLSITTGLPPHPPIVISPCVPESKLRHLYNSCDAFVLPTRAEGFGLPIVEAMACALPVIVTGYGAPLEYVSQSSGYLINVQDLVDVFDPLFFPARGQYGKWAKPDIGHLRHLLRYVCEHREEAEQKGRLARRVVCNQWTWDHAADIAYLQLGKLRHRSELTRAKNKIDAALDSGETQRFSRS